MLFNNKDHHEFIHQYKGFGAFGMDRKTDEETIMFYLQKFSEDQFMKAFIPRLDDSELDEIYACIHKLLKKHFSEDEYHAIFLKDI
ncbi:MAG: cytoplasmic protein [Desulfamplus sp.]|nr:cytoplasmic protein [Desulfamplus sp.]